MQQDSIEGGCFCKSVRYRLAVAPIASMVCHCQSCRRVAGAPIVAWVTVPVGSFVVTHGTFSELASSPPVRRSFCKNCGTHILYRNTKDHDTLDVSTCTLDNPNAFPPTHHSWLSHDLHWLKVGDSLPKFPESRSQSSE